MDKQQRREAAAAYKTRRQLGGVFQIRNTETGRILLRRTADLRGSQNRFQFAPCRPTGDGTGKHSFSRCLSS